MMPMNHQPPSFPLGIAPNENHTLGNGKAEIATDRLQTRQCLLLLNIINKLIIPETKP
jgi:hypothetical protein